jgi:hypothetical protein
MFWIICGLVFTVAGSIVLQLAEEAEGDLTAAMAALISLVAAAVAGIAPFVVTWGWFTAREKRGGNDGA